MSIVTIVVFSYFNVLQLKQFPPDCGRLLWTVP